MIWNVFYYSVNKSKVQTFNIFDHWRFTKDVEKDLEKYRDKEEFAKALRSNLFYYFCSKCEWEVLISPFCGSPKQSEVIKVDVYDQVMMNFDHFLDYVWTS